MKSELLPIVEFEQSYLFEAKRTFLRWRALVTRYYTLANSVEKNSSQLTQGGANRPENYQNLDNVNQQKAAERDAIRDLMPTTKGRTIAEIEDFQKRFKEQNKLIVGRYTELHQQSAQIQLQYWQDYMSGV